MILPSTRWLVLLIALLSWAALAPAEETSTRQYTPLAELQPEREHRQAAQEITRMLTRQHFATVTLDESLAEQTMENFLRHLDPHKGLLTQAQADAWMARSAELMPALTEGRLALPFEIHIDLSLKQEHRLQQNLDWLKNQLADFDLNSDERFQADRREVPRADSAEALDHYWRQRLTHELLNLLDADQTLEEARDLLVRRYENQLNRLRQTNSEDLFQTFMNAFTTSVDPHTNYLSPRRSESFNIQMRLSLEGIGAVLQTEHEYTQVVSLVPGGPADRQGQLRPTDRILSVGQGSDGELENVIGWRLDEVVEKIRGPKGSIVRLEVMSSDNTNRRVIEIERNAVQLEDQAASKRVIETELDGRARRIGVIEIPAFYMDFEGRRTDPHNYRSTTRDVARLINELEEEGIDGLVIDLRNNGGGALQEANSLVGLFIRRGPTVQVKDADGNINVMGDNNGRVHYDGPLGVVINRLSASASEIFAGAIQDYGRGIVVGEQSFGKGTVQTIVDLSHGQLKITRAKFYRVSGDSTQHRGIIPDIAFPALFDPERIGESASPTALPWDQVKAVLPPRGQLVEETLERLRNRHQQRAETDADFRYLTDYSAWLHRHDGSPTISLNLSQREQDREEERQTRLAMENQRRERLGLEPLTELEEEPAVHTSGRAEPTPLDMAILREAGHILIDFDQQLTSRR